MWILAFVGIIAAFVLCVAAFIHGASIAGSRRRPILRMDERRDGDDDVHRQDAA